MSKVMKVWRRLIPAPAGPARGAGMPEVAVVGPSPRLRGLRRGAAECRPRGPIPVPAGWDSLCSTE